MPDSDGRLLLLRALNYLMPLHSPTYLGMRVLAESIHPSARQEWINGFIRRKSVTNRRQVYLKYLSFKGLDRSGHPEHRVFHIGSPTTILTETWLLEKLSREPTFAPHPSVYSHHWPNPSSGRIFAYFFNTYRRREVDIASAVSRLPGSQVVVLDLRRFYPSIEAGQALEQFAARLGQSSLEPEECDTARRFAEELAAISGGQGLPIGPPLSHLLADCFLGPVDTVLHARFPGRYFRYVDDVALVVECNQVEEAREFFRRSVEVAGLSVNEDKTDFVKGPAWAAHVMARHANPGSDFAGLIRRLQLYLAYNQDDYDSLRHMFANAGFSLPFSRLRAVTGYGWFRRFLYRWLGRLRFDRRHRIALDRPESILAEAVRIRDILLAQARRRADDGLPTRGMARRWAVQDCRYIFNRLLYLLDPSRYPEVAQLLPEGHELAATHAVLAATIVGDASKLLDFPSPPVASFVQLWSERGAGRPALSWPAAPSAHQRDVVMTLALHSLCEPSSDWIVGSGSEDDRLLLNLAAGRIAGRRTCDNFSYPDELESLLMTPGLDRARLLSERFDDDEEVSLPALTLGGAYDS